MRKACDGGGYLLLLLSLLGVVSSCTTVHQYTLDPHTSAGPQVIKNRLTNPLDIRSVVVLGDHSTQEKTLGFTLSKDVEDILLMNGFNVVSHEILIRTKSKMMGHYNPKYISNYELALLYGHGKSKVDATVKIKEASLQEAKVYLLTDGGETYTTFDKELFAVKRKQRVRSGQELGEDFCILELPYQKFSAIIEINSLRTGEIIARGETAITSLDYLPSPYQIQFALEEPYCELAGQNFAYDDYHDPQLMRPRIIAAVSRLIDQMLVFEQTRAIKPKKRVKPRKKKIRAQPRPTRSQEINQSSPQPQQAQAVPPTVHNPNYLYDPHSGASQQETTEDRSLQEKEEALIESLKQWLP